MAKCNYCGSSIIVGGVKDGKFRFCNDKCHQNGVYLRVADKISPELLAEQIVEVHQGNCPRCGGVGPVDLQTSHQIWSIFVVSNFSSKPEICCKACGVKKKIGGIFFSFFFGWWGFPFGVIVTPIQIVRNFVELFSTPDPEKPSEKLEQVVKIHLAQHVVAKSGQIVADDRVTTHNLSQ